MNFRCLYEHFEVYDAIVFSYSEVPLNGRTVTGKLIVHTRKA